MWRFKPNEKKRFPMDVINNNKKFIENYKIVTPSIVEDLIKEPTFMDLYELYHIIPNWVTQSDLGRLLIIYFYGGIYSDADCFICKKLNQHSQNHQLVLFTENICNSINELGKRECKNPDNLLRVANYCFGSVIPKHPFLKEVINECLLRLKQLLIIENKTTLTHEDILWVCGPDVITTIYHKSKHFYSDIFLYDQSFLLHKCNGSWR
jgi:mannosyltransferase OCH1-like enzyme